MASAKATIDRGEIQRWVEERGGFPAHVKRTGDDDDPGVLRIDYPGYSGTDTLERISWDEWFEWFDRDKLAFLYQADGDSRFSKLVSRDSVDVSGGAKRSSRARSLVRRVAGAIRGGSSSGASGSSRKSAKRAGSASSKKASSRTPSKKSGPKKGSSKKAASRSGASSKKSARPAASRKASSSRKAAASKKAASSRGNSSKKASSKKASSAKSTKSRSNASTSGRGGSSKKSGSRNAGSSKKSAAGRATSRKTSSRTATRSSRSSGSSVTTTNHDEIRKWVEKRGGFPAHVKRTGSKKDPGVLRIDYPGYSGAQSLERISWEDWFRWFDRDKLAFLYQNKANSRFSKLVRR